MKPIGTKTITAVAAFLLTLGLAIRAGLLQAENLHNLSTLAGFGVGFFTVFVSPLLYRFLSLGIPSQSHFRFLSGGVRWDGEQPLLEWNGHALLVGSGDLSQTFELPPFVMGLLSLGICFSTALLCFNTRTVRLIYETPHRLISAGS